MTVHEYSGVWEEPTAATIEHWESIKKVVSPVTDGLYLSGFPYSDVQEQMRRLGITLLVSTTQRRPPDIAGVPVYRMPFTDDSAKKPSWDLKMHGEWIAGHLTHSEANVLVHCAYGLNRSALVAAYALKALTPSLDGKSILRLLREKRPGCLHNPLYADLVREL